MPDRALHQVDGTADIDIDNPASIGAFTLLIRRHGGRVNHAVDGRGRERSVEIGLVSNIAADIDRARKLGARHQLSRSRR